MNTGSQLGTACVGEGVAVAASSSPTFLTLPAPPSVNAMFRNTRHGRARTKLYTDWLGHAGWRLREQQPEKISGPVIIIIGIERVNNLADIDNRLKASIDLLKGTVIDDDRFVVGGAFAWNPSREGLMRIAIVPAGPITLQFHLADPGHGGWFIDAPQLEQEAA